jgi:hypothetical protein
VILPGHQLWNLHARSHFFHWNPGDLATNGFCACAPFQRTEQSCPCVISFCLSCLCFRFTNLPRLMAFSWNSCSWLYEKFSFNRSSSLSYFPPFFEPDRDTPLPSSFALPCLVCLRFAALAAPPRVGTVAGALRLVSGVESISGRGGGVAAVSSFRFALPSFVIVLRLFSQPRFKRMELFFFRCNECLAIFKGNRVN